MINNIELITSDLKFPSPFSHRVQIVCHEKNIPLKLVAIDVIQKPDWFIKIAPLGQIPVLRTENTIIPDSRAICEYLDNLSTPCLLPQEKLIRAQHQAWIAFSDEIAYEITQFIKQKKSGIKDLNRLNQLLTTIDNNIKGTYFFGDEISMVDIGLITHLMWIDALDEWVFPFSILQKHLRLYCWFQNLRHRPSIRETAGADFNKNFIERMRHRGFIE